MRSLCNTSLPLKLWTVLSRIFLKMANLLEGSLFFLVVISIRHSLLFQEVQSIKYWRPLSGTQHCGNMSRCIFSRRTCDWISLQRVSSLPSTFWMLGVEETLILMELSFCIQRCAVVTP